MDMKVQRVAKKKNWYAGAYTSLSLLLDSINNK